MFFSNPHRLMVQISHDVSGSFTPSGRRVRFLHIAFNGSGFSFVAADHQGYIYVFDLGKNRFVSHILCSWVWVWVMKNVLESEYLSLQIYLFEQ